MKLKIVTPERMVVETEVEALYSKTTDGMMGILPKHVPVVAPLAVGVMHYVQQGKKYPLAVMGGLLSTDGNTVTVLSDAAELGSEINTVRAQHAKERAEAELNQLKDKHDITVAQQALTRALVRLSASSSSTGSH